MARCTAQSVLVVLTATALVHLMLLATGDPSLQLASTTADLRDVEWVRHELGFDRPWLVQYADFLAHAVTGDFGTSLRQHLPVGRVVLERLPATLELALAATCIAVGVAVPLGVVAAVRRGGIWDRLCAGIAVIGQSAPTFLLGIGLLYTFGGALHWLPIGGRGSGNFVDELQHLALPAITLALFPLGRNARVCRASVLETLNAAYATVARGKGLTERRVVWRHALPNACIPLLTLAGLELGTVLGGAVITEEVFSWPGMGSLLVRAIGQKDIPVVLGSVSMLAACVVGLNLAVDVAYACLDPRQTRVMALLASGALFAIIALAVFAPVPGGASLADSKLPPAWLAGGDLRFVFGTDELGRDVAGGVASGARIALLVGFSTVALAGGVGIGLGLITGYYRGRVDALVSAAIAVQLALPQLVLAMCVATSLGPGLPNVILTLALTSWAMYARLVRGQALVLGHAEYVRAARCLGARDGRILLHHVLPNLLGPIVIVACSTVASTILAEAALSFLGLGVGPDVPTWGGMLAAARDQVVTGRWWMYVFPGSALLFTVLAVTTLGEWLRDRLDPRGHSG